MTSEWAISKAKERLSVCSFNGETLENRGLQTIYQRESEWLSLLIHLAEKGVSFERSCEVEDEKFICECLHLLFGYPCDIQDVEEELHSDDQYKWCEENCGKTTTADCWLHYFQIKFEERNKNDE